MERTPYPSDLTDEQWKFIESLIPPAKPGGRPRSVNMREVVNAILYLNRTGCSWRMLPHEFPPWGTVHYYYRLFRLNGLWSQIHDRLREQVRRQAGRKPTPSAAILDSQSVKTAEKGGTAAMTQVSRFRAVNDIFSLTPSG
jgi:putative transposase